MRLVRSCVQSLESPRPPSPLSPLYFTQLLTFGDSVHILIVSKLLSLLHCQVNSNYKLAELSLHSPNPYTSPGWKELPTFWPNQRPSVPLVFSCMFSISSQTVVIYSPTISQSNIYILRIILSSSFSLTTCDFKFPKLKGGVANKKIVINLWNFHRRSSQPVTC